MPTKLTVAQQRKLLNALPSHRINSVRKHCQSCQMRGEGILDIIKSVGNVLGPVVKEVGPTVLKELIIPMLVKKAGVGGKGISLPGGTLTVPGGGLKIPGGALRLAGQRKGPVAKKCGGKGKKAPVKKQKVGRPRQAKKQK